MTKNWPKIVNILHYWTFKLVFIKLSKWNSWSDLNQLNTYFAQAYVLLYFSCVLTLCCYFLVAIAAGRKLAHRLFNNEIESRLEYENIPSVVFTHPPIGNNSECLKSGFNPINRKFICFLPNFLLSENSYRFFIFCSFQKFM